jgi:predicted O-methyltransferase YrrM
MTPNPEDPAHSAGVRFHVGGVHGARGGGPLSFGRSEPLRRAVDAARHAAAGAPGQAAANPYALQPDTLALLARLLEDVSPKLIVEFGSGASTSLFARWAAAHGGRLLSIEHDRGWVERVRGGLTAAELRATDLRHAPLRLAFDGLRAFFTYRGLESLAAPIAEAGFILVDGPHVSGREPVLQAVLANCSPGATIVVDDVRHYAIRDMLRGVEGCAGADFAAEEVDDNSHGVLVMRCERRPRVVKSARRSALDVLRSYRRCWRDFRQYGTGA